MSESNSDNDSTDLYLRFRWLLNGLEDLPAIDLLKMPHLESLLADIAQAWQAGAPYAISILLVRSDLGHSNTVRKRLQQLEEAGFVDFERSSQDSRVRLVVPTQQALRYFREYANLLRQVGR